MIVNEFFGNNKKRYSFKFIIRFLHSKNIPRAIIFAASGDTSPILRNITTQHENY